MHRSFTSAACGVVLAGAFLCPSGMLAVQEKAPDNSAANKQDRNASAPSADQAKNTTSDRAVMKNIRHDIVNDKSLSTYAHNVKVVADHGKVTLKGPVRSEDEKRTIEQYARKYVSDGNLTSELTVSPEQK